MKITEKDVRYVAELANLDLSSEEIVRFVPQLDAILGYADKLNELDTSAVEPMAQVVYDADEAATLREDKSRPGFPSGVALESAPEKGGGYFKVPKVIER